MLTTLFCLVELCQHYDSAKSSTGRPAAVKTTKTNLSCWLDRIRRWRRVLRRQIAAAERLADLVSAACRCRISWDERRMIQPLVLIVEDEAPLQELLAYNLQRAGFDVEQAFDGDQAVDLVAERTPDLILLDWMLPHTSGIELCRQFRRKHHNRRN